MIHFLSIMGYRMGGKSVLGERLREGRGKRTQEEISEQLGISRARYSHYENNHVQPDNDLLQKMADLYLTSVDYLLGRTDNKNERSNSINSNKLSVNELVLKEIIERYNLDLTIPGNKEKLE